MKPWLAELVRDLKNVGPWFNLYLEPYGIVGGKAKPTAVPEVGDPALLYFPGPYHCLEVAAAMRGWGGVRPADPAVPVEKAKVIAGARNAPTWAASVKRVAEPLFLTPGQALLAAHLLSPVETFATDYEILQKVTDTRCVIYDALGFKFSDADEVVENTGAAGKYATEVKEFWPIVRPEVEDLL